jgi:ATP-dependent Lon protease
MQEDETIYEDVTDVTHEPSSVTVVSDVMPSTLPVLPIVQRPIFPGITVPLVFQGKEAQKVIREVIAQKHRVIGVVLVDKADPNNIFDSRLFPVGTVMRIFKHKESDEGVQILARAVQRFRFTKEIHRRPFLQWKVSYPDDIFPKNPEELKAYVLSIISSAKDLVPLSPLFQEQIKLLLSNINLDEPSLLMDLISGLTTADSRELQNVLQTFDMLERAKKVMNLLLKEIEVSKLQQGIKQQIDANVAKHQREFFLKEQLKIIKKELGIGKEDQEAELDKFTARFNQLQLTQEAQTAVAEEMNKLAMLDRHSPEYNVTRNWLDWVSLLPWGIVKTDQLDVQIARKTLNKGHYGLDDVKDRIIEFIATAKKKGSLSGSILCLVGPPGVGKTSIGKSIAEAIGRDFYRFSLGGMRDEAEIKGHRRTYIGAMPGKMIQSLKRTGSANPVIMLDEIDKLGASFQGDPASALLEVLDPEQNEDFLDHYLDVRFDLSKVLFITTANTLDSIPGPLLDRMEIIKLSGYLLEEKVEIAKQYLIPTQLKKHGLLKKDVSFTMSGLKHLISSYAREAGVRNLEKQLGKIMRRVTLWHSQEKVQPVKVDTALVESILGKPFFGKEELYNHDVCGVALGLAWTAMGGATLYIEAIAHAADAGGLKVTGKLGEVMNESAQLAYTYVRSVLDKKENQGYSFFNKRLVHLHVPEGATPKDGPSAGITMALALYSLAIQKPVPNIAMTGELTITGKVLPIGGVREKIIAARRVGIKKIIVPEANRRDVEELPGYVKKGVQVQYANVFEDVLQFAFGKHFA